MSSSLPARWITLLAFGALTAFGCVGTTDTGQRGETGSLEVDLVLADGVEIDKVGWQITGNDMDMSGDIDVSAPGSTASVEVFGLPPGATDYTVMLTATSTDETVTCQGSADFNVEIGQSTNVMVMLNCKKPRTLGGVRVNGKFNICTELTKAVVSPLQTSVGNDISLSAQALDEEGDDIHYIWTGTGGSIADPSAASTTYTCQEVGDHTVMIMVTDNDVYCRMATWTIPVTCVEGDGGDLCEDVPCEGDGNECTATECNPANGACETSNVAGGTECNGGAGACSAGQCVDNNLCEGADCDDNNECTADACDSADGSCSNTNVDNGTPCNNDEGVCSDGSCVDVNSCEGVVCDDTGNECTVAMCNNATGECDTMNVADGTTCDGGAGACSAGVCIDNNLCQGIDCISDNDCVQNGTCDSADGLCDLGDPQLAGTACDLVGTDDGFCDGAGACVECNDADQCPDDDNECTAAACESNACAQNNVTQGQACDFGGSAGMCDAGTCVAAPECVSDGDCEDENDNVCTAGSCPDGMCVFTPVDGGACDVSAGVPGLCSGGGCVGLCVGVNCASGSQCVMDGTCDDQTGDCVAGSNEPADTPCNESGGSVCDGAGNCIPDIVCPPAPFSGQAQTACRNSFNQLLSQFPVDYDIALDDCAFAGQTFNADVTPTLNFAESFLNTAATTLCPFGIDICTAGATFTDVQVRVDALAGATCTSVLSELADTPVTLPLTCSSACPNPVVTAPVAIPLPTVTVACTAGAAPGPVGLCATGTTPLNAAPGPTGTQDVDTWAEVSIGFPNPVSFQCGEGLVSDGDIACTADTDCPDGTAGETPFPTGSCDVGAGTCNTVPLALDPTVDCATFPVEP